MCIPCLNCRSTPHEEYNKVNKWREALTAAANLSGYHISYDSGGEAATINKMVEHILENTRPRGKETNIIGIESHMGRLNTLLKMEARDGVRLIGIYGMGGIGKTTIARALYGRIFYKFEGSSFVNDVREKSVSRRGICALQEEILGDILGAHYGFVIKDPEYGANTMRERFCNKKVLLILDDVDDTKQIEFLAAEHEWFGPGSRIIITTRDKRLLSDANDKYEPPLLSMDQAIELFSKHAFRVNTPPYGFEELSNRAIRHTGLLPLGLKVLGSFLHGRKSNVWESALDRLAKTQQSEIFETLKLSFDGLEESEKKIFLDIACFFKGKYISYVTRLLDSFGFFPRIGISSLIEKSLISTFHGQIEMHDLIQEMGWQVVNESVMYSRLWKVEEIRDFMIVENKKHEFVEAIVNSPNTQNQNFNSEVFESMKNLRLLDASGYFTCCEPTFLPHELRWLHWSQYPFSSLPLANMCKLVGLEMGPSDKLQHLWKGHKVMPNLKFIDLAKLNCLSRFPDVSGAPNIERLKMVRCMNLVEVHESLGSLKRLVDLNMSRCKNLKHLPSIFDLQSLKRLNLYHCRSLERLPNFSPFMVKLSFIALTRCRVIQELPASIKNVSHLSGIDLKKCTSLNNIPDSICELKYLKHLDIRGCSKLQKLPNALGNIEKLEGLDLHQDFPLKYLSSFSFLKKLSLIGSSKLIRLHGSISHLSLLKKLDVSYCQQLESFDGLPSRLEVLDGSFCTSLKMIKDLSKEYDSLHKILLLGCKKLVEDKENERYLDKMFNKSFMKRWAARNGCISITIPGRKIPSWFQEQHDGKKITLKLPLKWQTEIKGFAICGVFRSSKPIDIKSKRWIFPFIYFRFNSGGMHVPMLKVDCVNTSEASYQWKENVWVGYVPICLMRNPSLNENDDRDKEDWSYITEGSIVIELSSIHDETVRCGAQILYEDDGESSKQIIEPSYYWEWRVSYGLRDRNTVRCI